MPLPLTSRSTRSWPFLGSLGSAALALMFDIGDVKAKVSLCRKQIGTIEGDRRSGGERRIVGCLVSKQEAGCLVKRRI
jgi:hypothetical protein